MQDLLPNLCDMFPHLVQVAKPMFVNYGGRDTFSGEIVTIKAFEDNLLVREQVALPGKGKVLVIDGHGSMRRAMLGEIMAGTAAENGWEGIVVYGCIRDVKAIAQIDIGAQALSAHPIRADKNGVGKVNIPVAFLGVTFQPGHYLYADRNGILVSPKALTKTD